MRFSKITAGSSLVVFLIILLVDIDYPITTATLKSIDGGTIVFMLLIFLIAQLYSLKVFRSEKKQLNTIAVAALSNIMALLSIYGLMAVYFLIIRSHP